MSVPTLVVSSQNTYPKKWSDLKRREKDAYIALGYKNGEEAVSWLCCCSGCDACRFSDVKTAFLRSCWENNTKSESLCKFCKQADRDQKLARAQKDSPSSTLADVHVPETAVAVPRPAQPSDAQVVSDEARAHVNDVVVKQVEEFAKNIERNAKEIEEQVAALRSTGEEDALWVWNIVADVQKQGSRLDALENKIEVNAKEVEKQVAASKSWVWDVVSDVKNHDSRLDTLESKTERNATEIEAQVAALKSKQEEEAAWVWDMVAGVKQQGSRLDALEQKIRDLEWNLEWFVRGKG